MSDRFNQLKAKDKDYHNRQEYGKLLLMMKEQIELTYQDQLRMKVLQINLNLK